MHSSPTCSLVLAAHGSLAATDSNQPLFELAELISQQQRFASVTPAFLNGDPEMTNVLERLPMGDVVIVPVMTSEGYYLKKLPGKFDENECRNDFRLFMSRVVGVHHSIPNIIFGRIQSLLKQHDLPAGDTTVVVVGHGTKRNKHSGDTTYQLAEVIKEHALALPETADLKFEVGFLDQDPPAESVASSVSTKHTLVVPFLISRGPHTTEDVPNAFGLESGAHIQFPLKALNANGGKTICDSPMALFPEMADVCVELALEALEQVAVLPLPIGDPS